MNKAILLIVFTLLLGSSFIVPAMAAPAQKVNFVAVQVPNSIQPPPSPEFRTWVTDGFTVHVRNLLGAGMIWMDTTIPAGTPTGTTSSVISVNINVKTGEGDIKFVMTWTIGDGSYVGNIVGKLVGTPFTQGSANYNYYLHGVLHGQGDFEGQTVLLDGTRLVGQPFQWTGTIITPK